RCPTRSPKFAARASGPRTTGRDRSRHRHFFALCAQVLNTDGTPMLVRDALKLINQVHEEVTSTGDADYDSEAPFALDWFAAKGRSPLLYQLTRNKERSGRERAAAQVRRQRAFSRAHWPG